uniref:Scavenger receptor class B member 2 n=1 Tax=Steinernema glaseri TaxID=37863 RepID=A0A1I7YCT4_9BILA
MGKRGLVLCSVTNVLVFLIGCGLICAGLVVWLSVFPDMFVKELKKNKVLGTNDDGSLNDFTRSWMDSSGLRQNFYFFNYTNVFGIVDRGAKPDVHEKGPYAYKKMTVYEEYTFENGSDELAYRYRTSYYFDAENSCATCRPDDVFLIPDPVFQILMDLTSSYDKICDLLGIVVGELLGGAPASGTEFCTQTLPLLDQEGKIAKFLHQVPSFIGVGIDVFDRYGPFVAVKVEDFLFKGYQDPLFDQFLAKLAEFINSLDLQVPILGALHLPVLTAPSIHLFYNNSVSDTYSILTGLNNYLDIGKVVSFTDNNGTATNGSSLPEQWYPRLLDALG